MARFNRNKKFSTIVGPQSYLNVYQNPVLKMTRSMSKSAVKRKTKRENRGTLEDLNQTYHSNPPFKAAEAAD